MCWIEPKGRVVPQRPILDSWAARVSNKWMMGDVHGECEVEAGILGLSRT